MKEKAKRFIGKAKRFIRNERGDMSQLVWVVGAAVVVTLVIVGAIVYVPDTASNFWTDASEWVRSNFGF